jgi:hypothetical protein
MFGKIKITNFAKRHFDSKFAGTKIKDKTPEEFESILNNKVFDHFDKPNPLSQEIKIIEGYAPFCKLIMISNFTTARVGTVEISMENYQYLRSGFSSRTSAELPVLSRWFELPLPAPKANYLNIIVYSREQLEKEFQADMEKKFKNWEVTRNKTITESDKKAMLEIPGVAFELTEEDSWGVVAILGQLHNEEEPMAPITMMRNALGVAEGGSGVKIDRDAYLKSVDFWSNHANVK